MRKNNIILTLLISSLFLISFTSCGSNEKSDEVNEHIDYALELKLDLNNTSRVREEVTVYNYVDGDTTHFNCKAVGGILKARYLAIDTPESTMKIEEWGKTASLFTRSKLESATSIIIESDDTNWNHDSSGERYLVWVWYKTESSDYRLLNLEIVQEGYSMVKNAESFEYGKVISKAYNQAIREKLHLFTDEKKSDPNYYYGDINEITLRELRNNLFYYEGKKIRFDCLITRISNQTAYCQSYDSETETLYGFPIYFGYTNYIPLQVGNMMSICGTLEYYETGDSWQVSDLTYIATKPDYSKNMRIISENNEVTPTLITKDDITNAKLVIKNEDESKKTNTNSLLGAYVKMNNLKVVDTYTTNNGGDNDGAITITCLNENQQTVTIRTSVLKDENKELILADVFTNKTIDVIGVLDSYDGEEQIKVISINDINFIN